MEETKVSFEVAELLKEVGFNVKVNYFFYKKDSTYSEHSERYTYNYNNHQVFPESYCSRPTQALAQKWFREVYNLHIEPGFCINGYVVNIIFNDEEVTENHLDDNLIGEERDIIYNKYHDSTYEGAFEKGLKQACLILKRKLREKTN